MAKRVGKEGEEKGKGVLGKFSFKVVCQNIIPLSLDFMSRDVITVSKIMFKVLPCNIYHIVQHIDALYITLQLSINLLEKNTFFLIVIYRNVLKTAFRGY